MVLLREMPEHTWFEKAMVAAAAAVPMYWAQIPAPVSLMLTMLLINVVMTALQKWIAGSFQWRLLLKLILISLASVPMLWACHLAETPLHVSFDIDSYAAYAIMGYAFLSIGDRYIALGGIGGAAIQKITDRVKSALQDKATAAADQRDAARNSPIIRP